MLSHNRISNFKKIFPESNVLVLSLSLIIIFANFIKQKQDHLTKHKIYVSVVTIGIYFHYYWTAHSTQVMEMPLKPVVPPCKNGTEESPGGTKCSITDRQTLGIPKKMTQVSDVHSREKNKWRIQEYD